MAPRIQVGRSLLKLAPIYNEKTHIARPCTLLLPLRGTILTFVPDFPTETQKVPEKRNLRHFDNSDNCV